MSNEPPWLIDRGPITPSPEARQRLIAALREHPAGLRLEDAACVLIDPDQVPILRNDIALRPAHDQLAIIRMNAANAVLGALQEDNACCELRYLPLELGSDFVMVPAAQVNQLRFSSLDLAKSEIARDASRFAARIFARGEDSTTVEARSRKPRRGPERGTV